MKIETRKNIGNEIFFLKDKKITKAPIGSIRIEIDETVDNQVLKTKVTYLTKISNPNAVLGFDYSSVSEEDAFDSKEEFIKSLD